MAPSPVIADPSRISRRARIRLGVAATLLATAVAMLVVLGPRRTEAPPLAAPPAIRDGIPGAKPEARTALPVAETSALPARAAQPSAKPAPSAGPTLYEVQPGVFGDMQAAKQLQAKLAEHGIPSRTETSVRVGPFKTRAEADEASEKLKALGISAAVIPR